MREYFEKYSNRIFLMGLFVFLIHGAKLHSGIIGIDTEDIIHIQNDFYGGWLNTGRQGLYALKWLMNSLNFQPYMAGLMTLIFFTAAVSAFFLLWDKVIFGKANRKKAHNGLGAWIAGGLFLIAHPVITEQLYFTLQSVEISIGLLLTASALYQITKYREAGGLWRLFVSWLFLILNFSIYQAFVVIYIFGTVSVLLSESISKLQDQEISVRELLKGIFPYLGVFLASFAVNTVITKLFFSVSDYLGGQILWGKFDIMDNFRAIVGHVIRVFTGYEGVHYHFSFGLLCIAVLSLIMIVCVRFGKTHKKKGVIAVVLFYFVALIATQFLMTLVCGGAPVVRSQLVLPLMTGFLAYMVITLLENMVMAEEIRDSRIEHIGTNVSVAVVAVICIVGIWEQTSTTMSLYYTDEMRYDQDVSLGRELITAIERVSGEEELPVAIVGRKSFSGNNACVTGEIIGKSFFDHDVEVEPQYYWSTRRILGFLHVLGADYQQVDKGRSLDVVNYSMNMPSWPAEDSVQIYDGMVIVKLSDIE